MSSATSSIGDISEITYSEGCWWLVWKPKICLGITFSTHLQLIEQFEQFQFGKLKLVEIRTMMDEQSPEINISKSDAQSTIRKNKKTKEKYEELIMDIGKSFRMQIKG